MDPEPRSESGGLRHFLAGALLFLVFAACWFWPRGETGPPASELRQTATTLHEPDRIADAREAAPAIPPAPPQASELAGAGSGRDSGARLHLRTEEESAAIRNRHQPYLAELGWAAEALPMPRRPLPKEPLDSPPGEVHAITVKFVDDYLARPSADGALAISRGTPDSALSAVIEAHGLRFAREHTASDEALARLEARAIARTGEMAPDHSGTLSATPKQGDPEGVRAAAEALLALEAVEYVALSSVDAPPPPPAPYDIAPPSELLSTHQTYRGNSGIRMDWAWSSHASKGQGVRVTNCEYAYNPNHEDLATLVNPQPNVNSYYSGFGDDHGTAVLGVLTAGENLYGMTGMVPEASVWFYPESATVNGQSQSRLAAVTAAIAASAAGDVVLLEMQAGGAQGNYGPAEYNLALWNAVKTGSDGGVIVVAAAGNGNENLDAPEYSAYRNRGDSGAIIVGAGSSARAKLSFSTHGSRVNVQGWGQGVATLGYGGLRTYGGDANQTYTSSFSGTSSASPIVTSAVVALQGLAKAALGRPLTPAEMRQLIVETGQPQTGSLSLPIGPLPDMQAAIAGLQALFQFPSVGNPTRSQITATEATLGGRVLGGGAHPVTERGVIYAPATYTGSLEVGVPGVVKAVAPGDDEIFTVGVAGLAPATDYRFRAYATNVAGNGYSDESSFLTKSVNADLQSLLLSGATLTPAFSPQQSHYTATAGGSASSITAQPTSAHSGATLRIRMNGGDLFGVASGTTSPALALKFGENALELHVTAEDGETTRQYHVAIERFAPPELGAPRIGGLSTSGAVLGCEVSAGGGGAILERGILYAPTLANSNPFLGGASVTKLVSPGGVGPYEIAATGLGQGVRYSYKGFCRTAHDTVYSEPATFVTSTRMGISAGATTTLEGLYIATAETVGFQFTIAADHQTVLSVGGATGLSAVLRNESGEIVAQHSGDGDIMIDEELPAGAYSLEISNDGFWGRVYSLSAKPLLARPDLLMGTSLSRMSGGGVFGPSPAQRAALVSRRLRSVKGFVAVSNASGTPERLRLQGSRATPFFAARYTDAGGNRTAAVVAGGYLTEPIARGHGSRLLVATFAPSKRRLALKRRGKTVVVRKTARFSIGVSALSSPSLGDRVEFRVMTR